MRNLLIIVVGFGAFLAAVAVWANENATEEIIVTATKREQTLQEVPIAVSVATAETIEQAQIRDLGDLQTIVPSLRVEQRNNSSNTNFFIRGFGNGDNNPGVEPSVAVFIDNVYRSRSAAQIADLPNIQRIEVLRGPQSTLFGKNASAGVISIVTKKPQFEFSGGAEVTYGNYNTVIAKSNVTGPLSDSVALTLAGNINQRDGYIDVLNLGAETNDRDRWDVRADLLINASDSVSVRIIGDYGVIDEICCGAANLVSGPTGAITDAITGGMSVDSENPFSYDIYQNVLSPNEIDNYGFSAQVDYELESYSFTSISSYREVEAEYGRDTDFVGADLVALNEGYILETFTQEFRLASNFDGPVNFLLGGYYFEEKVDVAGDVFYGTQFRPYANQLLLVTTAGALDLAGLESTFMVPSGTFFAPGAGLNEAYELDNEAYSLFGTIDLEVNDRLTFTGGFNYTDDSKEFASNVVSDDVFSGIVLPPSLSALQAFQFLPPFMNFPNEVEEAKTDDDDWSWTARASFQILDNVNVYATWATGFKASSVNLSRDSRPTPADLEAIQAADAATPNLVSGSRFALPEESEVFEIGLKVALDNGSINAAVFEQKIEDFQSNVFTGTGFALSNAGEQSTFGVEFEGNYSPTDSLDLFLSVTYLDPEYDSFERSAFGDLSGEEPSNIANVSLSVGGTYTHVLDNGIEIIGRMDYIHEDDTRLRDGYDAAVSPDAVASLTREVELLNGAVTAMLNNGVEISLWGRNLLDDEYLVSAFDSTAQRGSVSGYPNQPRTFGGTVRIKF